MDLAADYIASKAADAAVEAARTAIIKRNRDQYNEDDVKKAILTELQGVKDDTEALRNADFRTARDRLRDWYESTQPIDVDANILNLREANNHAARAFNTVSDPLDKMTALSIRVYALYHHVALTTRVQDGSPDWTAGKREAQRMFGRYVEEMKELEKASKEELGLSRRRFFKDKTKRRKMLLSFINLSAAVSALPPSSFDLNANHPRLERLEHAVRHAIENAKENLVLSAWARHILLTEPLEAFTLRGHADCVTCCAVVADGTRAISGSVDSTLRVWDLGSGEEIQTRHTNSVRCCAMFADGTRVISGGATLRVWDLRSGEAIRTLEGHTDYVRCCAVFADGTRAISGSLDKTLKVWNLESGEEICTLKGHTCWVRCCAMFADGTRAISGSDDHTLKVWDLESGEEMHTITGHTGWVTCCAAFSEGTMAISGSGDKTLKVWDLEMGEEIHTLEGHTGTVTCCAVFAEGTMAISGSGDNTLKIWELGSGEEIHTLEGHTNWVDCCAVFAEGTRAISGSLDNTLKVWNLPLPHPSCLRSVPMLTADGNKSDSS